MARTRALKLVVLIGLPGAGKSTLARALAVAAKLVCVDRDAIRAARFPHGTASAAEKQLANLAVWRAAALRLGEGRSVVIDGMTFASRAQRWRGRQVARSRNAECVQLFLACPKALARRRVGRSPDHPAPDRSPRLVYEVARRFEPPSRAALRIDARWPLREQLRRARLALRG